MYWGGDFKTLTELLNTNILKPSDIRFFLGYSGWSVDQLKEELKESSWIVTENKYPNLLQVNSATLWKNQLMEFGGEYQIWANAPKNPALN
jgi:putative transcriptional regulator